MTIKVFHVVDSLSINGRTILLQELVRRTIPSIEHIVITLKNTGKLTHRFDEMGIEVHALKLYKPLKNCNQNIQTIKRLIRFKPDICVCWSGDSNIFSTLARAFRIPVIWTIHNSTIVWDTLKTRYGVRFTALLSKFVPNKIICCSNKTYEVYRDIHHYKADKLAVIPNGIDASRYQPDSDKRKMVRNNLGISDKAIVISTAARVELAGQGAQGDFKDLETLFKAASIVCQRHPTTYFLLFGSNLNYKNKQLVGWLDKYNLQSNVKLLDFQKDVAGLFAASDMFAMSSTSGEGLPISLLEAMACGAIPVCTDSGDIAKVVGSAGIVVPQKNAEMLAKAMLEISEYSSPQRAEYSQRATDIVDKSYSIDLVTKRYIDIIVGAIPRYKHRPPEQTL